MVEPWRMAASLSVHRKRWICRNVRNVKKRIIVRVQKKYSEVMKLPFVSQPEQTAQKIIFTQRNLRL